MERRIEQLKIELELAYESAKFERRHMTRTLLPGSVWRRRNVSGARTGLAGTRVARNEVNS